MITLEENEKISTAERVEIIDRFIDSPACIALGLSKSDVLRIFNMYRGTYYDYKNSAFQPIGRQFQLAQEDLIIKEHFLSIIDILSYVPGGRQFHVYMYRLYDMRVSVARCNRLMKEMNLDPHYGRPPSHKAAKKPGTHCHICAAVDNLVNQNFYLGPRKIILTDITYLHIKEYDVVIYLCVFYDCFTKEALGWSVSRDLSTKLVVDAFDMMISRHGELKGAKVYIHSDQGAQYASTTFKQLLHDYKFIQSMSQRANSQDNAPMEAFWSVMKSRIERLLALCPNVDVAARIVSGYLEEQNHTYQFFLAGLSPVEFYEYTQTGVYPLEDYFGVDASELDAPKKMIDACIAQARKRNQQQREAYQRKREQEQKLLPMPPEQIVERDQATLQRELNKQEKKKDKAEKRINFVKKVQEKAKVALEFIQKATEEVQEELWNPQKWRCYPELDYVYDMNGMF